MRIRVTRMSHLPVRVVCVTCGVGGVGGVGGAGGGVATESVADRNARVLSMVQGLLEQENSGGGKAAVAASVDIKSFLLNLLAADGAVREGHGGAWGEESLTDIFPYLI